MKQGLPTFTIEVVDGLSDEEKDIIRQDVELECQRWIDNNVYDFHFRDEEECDEKNIEERVNERFEELGEDGWVGAGIINFDKDDDKYEYQYALIIINKFIDQL